MLRNVTALRGDVILARDGDMGLVVDVYFDDERWSVRHLVVDTGTWFASRVLISPASVESIDWPFRKVHAGLERETVRRSPRG